MAAIDCRGFNATVWRMVLGRGKSGSSRNGTGIEKRSGRTEEEFVMLRQARVAVAVVMLTCMLTLEARTEALAGAKLPDPSNAAVAEKLYRLDCGHSLANDESVWTPGENIGRDIEFSSTCWLVKHG